MVVSDYVARIGSSNPTGLVAVTYELIMDHVEGAISNQDDDNEFTRHIELAMGLLGTLIDSLDMDYELSRTLFPLYIYINKLLINAKLTGRTGSLEDVKRILNPLYMGWQELAENESDTEPSMDKSQKIFAGLTYGRGELNEYIQEDGNKSYTI
jgi:flagellar protein FliS